MEIKTDELIEALDEEANWFSECNNNDLRKSGVRAQMTANVLRRFRDTLISIAQCQNGIASHQAQDTLKMAGYCYHFNSVYHAGPGPNESGGIWKCSDCNTESPERPVPYR